MLFGKTFDDLTSEDMKRLVAEAVREDRQLDYKAELPGGSDKEKKEFAADVASFANASGGYIIFGIADAKNASGQNTGAAGSADGLLGVNTDQQMLRLGEMIRKSIDPVIPGFRMKVLDGAKGPIILLHIPKSWSAPHMVTFGSDSRFFSRNSVGKQPLDVHEIRSAFLLSAEISKRIRQFRDERLGRIVADETPVMLNSRARLIVHLVPFSAMNDGANIDIVDWAENYPRPMTWQYANGKSYNIDGLVIFGHATHTEYGSYVQVFRSGTLEAVDSLGLDQQKNALFRPWLFEKDILKGLKEFIRHYRKHCIETPIVITVSFVSVKGAVVPRSIRSGGPDRIVDRDTLILPDVLLREYNEDLPTLMRPMFDAMWQAAGMPKSRMYDENGQWGEDNYRIE